MILWLLVAYALDKAQLLICQSSYGSPYCGVGTADGVNRRDIPAPMAYRVLMPWLLSAIEKVFPTLKRHRLSVYEAFKILAMAWALWAIAITFGSAVALMVGCLLPMTFQFDYWDWAVELGALALALGGNFQGAIIGGVLAALSRETALLVPMTYGLVTHDWIGSFMVMLATGLTLLGVKLWVGYKPLYCDRFMWKRNIQDLKTVFQCSPWFSANIFQSALVTTLIISLIVIGRGGAAWPVPLIVLAAGWLMAIASETRVFTPCLLWIAIGILR